MPPAGEREADFRSPVAGSLLAVDDLERAITDEPSEPRSQVHELRIGGSGPGGAYRRDLDAQHVRRACERRGHGCRQGDSERGNYHPLPSTS